MILQHDLPAKRGRSRERAASATINASCGAGFGNDDFGKQRKLWLELFPNPYGDIFTRRILQAGNFVEVTVIQLLPNRFKRVRNFGVVHHPAEFGIALARDGNFHLETVPMQAAAFVRFGKARQEMRGFKLKCFS